MYSLPYIMHIQQTCSGMVDFFQLETVITTEDTEAGHGDVDIGLMAGKFPLCMVILSRWTSVRSPLWMETMNTRDRFGKPWKVRDKPLINTAFTWSHYPTWSSLTYETIPAIFLNLNRSARDNHQHAPATITRDHWQAFLCVDSIYISGEVAIFLLERSCLTVVKVIWTHGCRSTSCTTSKQ